MQDVDEPGPLELQLDGGEVQPGRNTLVLEQDAEGAQHVPQLFHVTPAFHCTCVKLKIPCGALEKIKQTDDVASIQRLGGNFLHKLAGKMGRG